MDGKVAVITGAARGQGRAHAVKLAGEGADIIATDIAGPVDTVKYPPATPDDLAETVKEIEALNRRVVSFVADVRDHDALAGGLAAGVAELGGLDVVVANAGIINAVRPSWELDEADWQTMLDVNLTGVWHATQAAVPHLIERGAGGSVILISSTAGLRGIPGMAHYNAAKHGVLGLARTLANELAPHRIRVNPVHPTNVRTTMIDNRRAPGSTGRTWRPRPSRTPARGRQDQRGPEGTLGTVAARRAAPGGGRRDRRPPRRRAAWGPGRPTARFPGTGERWPNG